MLTLAIFYLTKFNIPRFMDLTFQVPMQYCSLQLQNLLSSLDTSSTGHHFCFHAASSFFLHSSPVAYWTPSNLGDSSPSIISFSLFTLFMGFSQQEDCSGLPFSPSVNHIVSELFTMTHPSWVALQGIAHSFTELCKPLHHNKAVIHERRYSIYRVILNDQI